MDLIASLHRHFCIYFRSQNSKRILSPLLPHTCMCSLLCPFGIVGMYMFPGWSLEIGEPVWKPIPGKNWFFVSQQPLTTCCSSSRGGIMWNFSCSCGHVNWYCCYAGLVQVTILLRFHRSSSLSRRHYLATSVLSLRLFKSSCNRQRRLLRSTTGQNAEFKLFIAVGHKIDQVTYTIIRYKTRQHKAGMYTP